MPYEGEDLREKYGSDDAPGLADDKLPEGWTRFDPDDGEAEGDEAYIFANGHQVLIGGCNDDWWVLAYPEQGMADLMGFVRPLAGTDSEFNYVGSLRAARRLAQGYMAAVTGYERDTVDAMDLADAL